MNVHKIWLLLLFLLIPTILFAQKTRTVKGLVCTISETKKGEEPLPYASLVILEGKDSAFVKGVASDADGRFNLQFTPQKGTQQLTKPRKVRIWRHLSNVFPEWNTTAKPKH